MALQQSCWKHGGGEWQGGGVVNIFFCLSLYIERNGQKFWCHRRKQMKRSVSIRINKHLILLCCNLQVGNHRLKTNKRGRSGPNKSCYLWEYYLKDSLFHNKIIFFDWNHPHRSHTMWGCGAFVLGPVVPILIR